MELNHIRGIAYQGLQSTYLQASQFVFFFSYHIYLKVGRSEQKCQSTFLVKRDIDLLNQNIKSVDLLFDKFNYFQQRKHGRAEFIQLLEYQLYLSTLKLCFIEVTKSLSFPTKDMTIPIFSTVLGSIYLAMKAAMFSRF